MWESAVNGGESEGNGKDKGMEIGTKRREGKGKKRT